MFCKNKTEKGFSIIELLVVVVIIGVALGALLGISSFSLKNSIRAENEITAEALAQEAIEVVRSYRDSKSWTDAGGIGNLTLQSNYKIQKTGDNPPQWALLSDSAEQIGIFQRTIIFSGVNRDVSGAIVETGGAPDSDTRKVIATVSWQGGSVELAAILTNWR